MKRKIATLLVLALSFVLPLQTVAYNVSSASTYMSGKNNNAWTVMGLKALGASNVSASHLTNINSSNVLDYASAVLAITAVGQNPRTFGATDYVAKIHSFVSGGQIGSSTSLNDDIFGLLALISAGVSASDASVTGAKNFILNNQNSNGGWSFNVGGASDTNTTGAAIAALRSVNVPASDTKIQNGLNYLRGAQNADGGFPYDPNSSFGRDSDSSSTAWALWGFNAVGASASGGREFLESTQTSAGYFAYQTGVAENSFSAINTAYAVIALQGKTLPLAKYSPPVTPSGFSFQIIGSSGTICSGQTNGPSVMDIVVNASAQCNFTYSITETDLGPYLERVNNDQASGSTGWTYTVNGQGSILGASEYILQNGQSVVWQFGNGSTTPPPPAGAISKSVNLSVEIEREEIIEPVLSFTINPTQISFGKLRPGQSTSQAVTVVNNGTVNIEVTTQVTGDSLFTNNLQIGNSLWQNFLSQLGVGASRQFSLNLSVPDSYADPAGLKNGQVIFWAAASAQ